MSAGSRMDFDPPVPNRDIVTKLQFFRNDRRATKYFQILKMKY
jgi:hypothetical protein